MAVTAAMTLSSATCKTGQSVEAILTFTNGNAEDVEVVEVQPRANPANEKVRAPVLLGAPSFPAGSKTVPAGGTLAVTWGVTPLAPATRGYSAAMVTAAIPGLDTVEKVYDIGADWKVSDGTAALETVTTLTVSTP